MNDNLAVLEEFFERREDSRLADGYTYFCRDCGLECNVGEVPFACRNGEILPVYIKCRYGCGRSWHLRIVPAEQISVH